MAAEAGKNVIVAALADIFEEKPFSEVESIEKLTVVCKNFGLDVSFSIRLSASKETVVIDNVDMVCLMQYHLCVFDAISPVENSCNFCTAFLDTCFEDRCRFAKYICIFSLTKR